MYMKEAKDKEDEKKPDFETQLKEFNEQKIVKKEKKDGDRKV